jgi:PAS fold
MAVQDHPIYRIVDTTDANSLRRRRYSGLQRTAALMTCTDDCIKLMSPQGVISYMSLNGQCAMEINELDSVLGTAWWSFWPKENQPVVRSALDAACRGKTANFVAECPTAAGNMKRWDVTVQGVFDGNGAVREVIAVSRKTSAPVRDLTTF